MKTAFKQICTLILCILVSAAIALAVPKDNGKGKGADKEKETQSAGKPNGHDSHDVEIIWRQTDRDHVKHYYLTSSGGLPPGLAKRRGDLPPGLEKQLRRNGHLPPGLEKKLMPFPVELERRLPPLMPGTTRGMIGASAVILNSKTSLILDVFTIL
jgi:hypothetical protein